VAERFREVSCSLTTSLDYTSRRTHLSTIQVRIAKESILAKLPFMETPVRYIYNRKNNERKCGKNIRKPSTS
jgi:hypothetical protein